MKTLLTILGITLFAFSGYAQTPLTSVNIFDSALVVTAKASCGQCQFGMQSEKGCELAVRVDGETYWVDGASIHDYDSHDVGDFCIAVRDIETIGEIINGRYYVSYFKVLPLNKSVEATKD